MSVTWTKQQQQVIDLRDRNLLVSAAAGSGKTAVLVERIIQKVLDAQHPVDIDHLLVVTFTKAAAAEMRERVAAAIEKRMEQEPGNAYLNRQYTLVHHAKITTIDSFCLYVVKNYFPCIDLEPGFRVGDPGELSLLAEDVLADVLERWYEQADPAFLALADNYASAKSDAKLAGLVRSLYEYSRSYPWSDEWLRDLDGIYQPENLTAEALSHGWFAELMDYLHAVVEGERQRLLLAKHLCEKPDGPDMYLDNIERVLEQMEGMDEIRDYDALGLSIAKLDFGRLGVRRGFDGDKDAQELVKALRTQVKEELQKLYKKFFTLPLEKQLEDLALVGKSVHTLAELTRDYANAYSAKKQEQGLLDFSDIEHLALQILVDPETKEPTLVAKEFQGQFEEVMIDEYQDSNYVQEAILSAVSGGGGRNNRFMVGDVKQSIYRFRLARPELFMEKYDTYGTEDGDCQKICLDKNFRSRPQVLDSVNDLFYRIMKRDLGGVAYDEAAALYPGADYPKGADGAYRTRILLADAQPQAMAEQGFDDSKQLEAALIAEEITHLMENGQVSDGAGGFRRVRYSDIVILLRSLSWADELVEQLSARDIPSHRTSQTGYFGTSEVQTILSLCQVIDNPLQDIPLAAVLRSSFCSFSNEELALLRLAGEHDFFYGHIREYADAGEDAPLREKCAAFLEWLSLWRERARHLSVHDLLDELLRESGYLNILRAYPAGEKRLANVEQLLLLAANFERSGYKGLFSFIRYMEQLQKYQVDFGEADVTDEQADVVRIMSIHKSKGLEFPVVFVSGLGRKFNKKDSTDEMIFDSTYGVGLTLVEGEKRRKRTTLLKQMIAARIAGDNMGEELRVLYVALTRAKEQLILTGTARDLEKTLLNYELQSETDASYLDRREAGCYLDWIMPGAYRHPEHLSIETFEPQELTLLEQLHEKEIFLEREALLDGLEPVDAELYRQIAERMDSTYAWQEEVSLKTKVSVSELKRRNMILEPGDAQTLAWYAKEQEPGAYSGALRGTAMHRVMECLDYGRLSGANADSVKGQLDELVEQGRISEEMAALVNTWKIGQFLQTGLAKRIMQAHNKGMLYREQPFVMGIPANEADPEVQSEELVLVQGIIDLYFEEPDGLVLLDYKTDSVKTAGQLLDRYQTQMDLYARALAAATGKPVKEKIIYSFKLEEMIYA